MADCLFCAIVAGEIPSTEVLSTDLVYAFRDLNPVAPTHVLVVPREHIADAADIAAGHGDDARRALRRSLAAWPRRRASRSAATDSCSTSGPDAGNTVPHLHLHLLGGRQLDWPPG